MRRALVSGGTKGIGLAIARVLAQAGDEVVALYASDDAAARAAETALQAEQLAYRAVRCDVASAAAVDALFAVEGERGFDLFVHAAGFTRDKLMLMMPEHDFDDVVAAHLKGGFLVGNWCGDAACEAAIKAETSATIRLIGRLIDGRPQDIDLKISCVRCGRPPKHEAYFAQAY